jgi:hypothetical protein
MSRNAHAPGDQIEFLPPNDAAFGMADIADFVGFDGLDEDIFGDEGPRSRWLPALAGFVIVALLGGGVIAAAPWDDGEPAATPTTTTTPTSTTTAPTTSTTPRIADVQVGPPGFVIDEPGSFLLAGAWSIGDVQRPPDGVGVDWFDLWTTADAGRTSGRWLAVTTLRAAGGNFQTKPNGIRITVGRDHGVIVAGDDGVTRLTFTALDHTAFEVGGYGFTLPDLLAFATEIQGAPDHLGIEYGTLADSLLSGMTTTVSRAVPFGGLDAFNLLSQPEGGVYYISSDYAETIEVQVSQPADVDSAVYDFLLPPPMDLGVDDEAALDAIRRSGVPVQLGANPDWPDNLVAYWMTARGAVTVSTTGVSVSTLLSLLPSLRLTEQDEWSDLVNRSNRGEIELPEAADGEAVGTQTVVGRSESLDDEQWWQVEMLDKPAWVFVSSDQSGWGGTLGDIDSAPKVHRFAAATITFVVGTAEWPNTARVMRVTVDGQPPIDVPMVQVGATPVYAAGYAYRELAGVTVEFFDTAGNPVTP